MSALRFVRRKSLLLYSLLSVVFVISIVTQAAGQVTAPTVETRNATNVSETTAIIMGRIVDDGGASIDERRFSWGTTPSCSDGWTASVSVSGSYFSYYLAGLDPSTTYYFQPWAHNSAGWGKGSPKTFKTLSPCSACTPASPNPSNGETNVSVDDYLSWSCSGGSGWDSFDVYFGTSSSPPLLKSSHVSTSYNLPTLNSNTRYYWKIVGKKSGCDSATGSVWNFTTESDTPSPPTHVSPANGSTIDTLTPTFTWNRVSNADYYGLYISEPPYGEDHLVFNSREDYGPIYGTSLSLPTGKLARGVTYYWNMQAYNSEGGWGSYSTPSWRFTTAESELCSACTPASPNPSNGETNVSVDDYLSWSCSGGSGWDSFDVYFGTSSSPPLLKSSHVSTSYNLPTLNSNTRYYWKIVGKKSGCDSATGSVWNFTTESELCSACTPASPNPSNGETNVSVDDYLSWSCSGGSGWDSFDVYFGTSSSPPLLKSSHVSTSYNLPTLNSNTRYYWKIVGKKSGCDSATGSVWNFTTESELCSACTPASPNPSNGETNVSVDDYLSWSCSGGSGWDSFDVYFGTSSSPPLLKSSHVSTSYNLPTLNSNTRYYWKIVGKKSGCDSATGSVWNFTTESELCSACTPASPNPSNGETNVSVDDYLSWSCSGGSGWDSFDVYFGTSSSPPLLKSSHVSTSYNLPTLNSNTRYYWKIVGKKSGCDSATGSVWNFTTESELCSACTPASPNPSNGETNVSVDDYLSWSCSGGSGWDSFDVYFGTSSSPPLLKSSHVSTSYNLPTLNSNTRYYWKIVGKKSGCDSATGSVWNFTTESELCSACTPASPNPSNGETNVSVDDYLSWSCSGGSGWDSFDVYFGTSSSPPLLKSSHVSTSYNLPTLNSNTRYYWKIVGKKSGCDSATGSVWNFTTESELCSACTPASPNPSNGETNVSVDDYLSWSCSGGSGWDSFDVYFGTSSSPPLLKSSHVSTSYNLPTLNSNTRYYWKIVGKKSGCDSATGSVWNFTTESELCSACTPASPNPSNGETNVSVDDYLSWSCSGGSGWDSFDVYFGTSSSPPLLKSSHVSTSYNLPTLNSNTRYYWKIVGKKSGCDSATGSVWNFTTESELCSACTPASPNPSNGETNVSVDDYLSWSCSGGSGWDSFDVYFGTSSSPPLLKSSHVSTSYNLPTLNSNTRYYWKIVGKKSGCDSATGSVWNFTTESELCSACTPASPNPSNGETNVSVDDYLSWSCSGGSGWDSFDVYFGTSSSPPLLKSSHVSTSYNLPTLNSNTRYYWKIVGKKSGCDSATGSVWNFTTESDTPSPPTHVSPANGSTIDTLTPTFTWNRVSNADYYGLYISEPPYGEDHLVFNSREDYGPIYGTSLSLPTGKLARGVTYYWNMQAYNSEGGWGSYSTPSWRFTTAESDTPSPFTQTLETFVEHSSELINDLLWQVQGENGLVTISQYFDSRVKKLAQDQLSDLMLGATIPVLAAYPSPVGAAAIIGIVVDPPNMWEASKEGDSISAVEESLSEYAQSLIVKMKEKLDQSSSHLGRLTEEKILELTQDLEERENAHRLLICAISSEKTQLERAKQAAETGEPWEFVERLFCIPTFLIGRLCPYISWPVTLPLTVLSALKTVERMDEATVSWVAAVSALCFAEYAMMDIYQNTIRALDMIISSEDPAMPRGKLEWLGHQLCDYDKQFGSHKGALGAKAGSSLRIENPGSVHTNYKLIVTYYAALFEPLKVVQAEVGIGANASRVLTLGYTEAGERRNIWVGGQEIIVTRYTGTPPRPNYFLTYYVFMRTRTGLYAADMGDTLDWNQVEFTPGCSSPDPDVKIPSVICIGVHSPVSLCVYDASGNATGTVNGEMREEIPESMAYEDGLVLLFDLTKAYRYAITGTQQGTYGLTIAVVEQGQTTRFSASNIAVMEQGQTTRFSASNISVSPSSVHQYAIDWDALARGEEGVTIQIDNDGDGVFERTVTADNELIAEEIEEPGIVPAREFVSIGPNPVPDTGTTFFYSLPVGTSTAKLMVFSATRGRLLFETSIDVNEARFPATGTWDPVDNDGVKLANGPYLYVLIANGQLIGQGKMVIQR